MLDGEEVGGWRLEVGGWGDGCGDGFGELASETTINCKVRYVCIYVRQLQTRTDLACELN